MPREQKKRDQIERSFVKLPEDIFVKPLFELLDDEAKYSVSQTNRFFSRLEGYDSAPLRLLLQFTAEDKEEYARKIIQKNPALILARGSFTERWNDEKRQWKSVSPLEYAAWSGNSELVARYLSMLPNQCGPLALQQLKKVKAKGVEHGEYLATFNQLISTYASFQQGDAASLIQYRKKVGEAQLKSTPFLLKWYRSHFFSRCATLEDVNTRNASPILQGNPLQKKFTNRTKELAQMHCMFGMSLFAGIFGNTRAYMHAGLYRHEESQRIAARQAGLQYDRDELIQFRDEQVQNLDQIIATLQQKTVGMDIELQEFKARSTPL